MSRKKKLYSRCRVIQKQCFKAVKKYNRLNGTQYVADFSPTAELPPCLLKLMIKSIKADNKFYLYARTHGSRKYKKLGIKDENLFSPSTL